jgi:hypothetical protein
MNINLVHLVIALNKIAEEYVQRGQGTLSIEGMDEYWIVEAPEWTDFQKKPELAVGSLADDWIELQKMMAGRMPTAVDLDRLAAVLRAVSERLASPVG